ncbi:DEAD/DEAH box helicase [Georgenia sp. 311]|uniref:DEAD/DEAH box helicase n=1 Tax=Georgenia sp. 311 TaxID=2585134 RepID=UPI00111238DD|nr:DEAD/DEAH box helicase [Georgenia sp. 311]TNC16614.1 DEAD/DEAH box helicase [Georgenia sp. 311]
MSELLPTVQAETIRESLLDYLTTTFALADEDARAALEEFLADPEDGIFKGPYVRLRLPFRPADPGWRDTLEWLPGFTPYGHQAAAFARLSSLGLASGERPRPTLVTTGTGSGKTEAFLYPILDHVRRAKRDGVTGIKALVLYPMNALANDQAGRLAALITENPELEGVRAALYTGQEGPQRTKVTADGLITNRREIRDNPPDILLTNYKMLDQLLLRADDAALWERSAHSLQYLVLDEFHTYDGAQGTDVSMLLRRLGLALKHHWHADDPSVTDADRRRPLGRITPVATSATLGDKGDPAAMLDFARTVFGEDIEADAVITESRLTHDEWAKGAGGRLDERGISLPGRAGPRADADVVERVDAAVADLGDGAVGERLAAAVLSELWRRDDTQAPGIDPQDTELLLDLLKAHPLTATLVAETAAATSVRDLARALVVDRPLPAAEAEHWQRTTERFVVSLLGAVSHVRAKAGRRAVTVDLHLWVRELTRIDRTPTLAPQYRWSDDGQTLEELDTHPLPALYCRHCGRSGWGVVLAPTGTDLDMDDTRIRARRQQNDDRFRALVHAATEGRHALDGAEVSTETNLRWFHVQERRLLTAPPADGEEDLRGGRILPVLVHVGDDAGKLSTNDTCPSCLQEDGIRFLGTAIATLLSVTLSTLFGDQHLDDREKKALVFTDSVQDAAHRAGFVQARSHTLTLRSLIRSAVGDAPAGLEEIVERMLQDAGDDSYRRHRLLPPDLADRDSFAPFWEAATARQVPRQVLRRVRRRLLLDVELEFGLQAGIGRTLERTGSVAGEVDIDEALLRRCAERAVTEAGGMLLEPSREQLLAWARGVLTRMRKQGAIYHEWFAKFQQEDGNRWSIWGGRRRSDGMPAFPKGRPAPGYPRVGKALGTDTDLEPVGSARGWYANWTARTLGIPTAEGATLARLLFAQLATHEVVNTATSASGAQVYSLPPSSVVVHPISLEDMQAGRTMLRCTHCESLTAGTVAVVRQLTGAPCLVSRCSGTLEPTPRTDNFYRHLYANSDPRRVVAREHTSLLDDEVRLAYETEFKAADPHPSAPNVLVATPTLEMGIDIGDLSTVMLSALPRRVSSYLQRVGRAGRLTGNALVLAYVTGRGEHLPRLGDPLSVIDGKVRPPATYLDAEEILRRQLVAAVADTLSRDPSAPHPARAVEAIGTTAPGSYLHALAVAAESRPEIGEAFLAGFPTLSEGVRERLREWTRPSPGPGTSPLAARLAEASQRWNHTVETLQHRRAEIQQQLPELEQRAGTPAASEDDKAAFRAARAGLKLAGKQLADLRGEYWIGVLEEYGLLPNYTLLDDSVSLDVSISWVDPDTGDYEDDSRDYSRASAVALRDFAPGATFYSGGYAITIDAVDLGHEAEAIRTHAFCAACGYAHPLDDVGKVPTACPRCGDTRLPDLKQRMDVVELERVSSAISRERATIDDSRDDRIRTRYTVLTGADVDPAKIVRQWFVEDSGFGAKYLRDMTLRWVNVGEAGRPGAARELAGTSNPAPLFRVCEACGHQDTDTRANRPTEHRPWCRHRKAATESTRSIALSRTLRTEGIVLRLPASVTLGDRFAVPSLAAALLLGLRERIGGDPDHLAVATTVDPTPVGTDPNPEALLLHDVVPGGTGYLAELADPDQMWQILLMAWEQVRECPCQDEHRLACHRCLLPFAQSFGTEWVSRAVAERHLREILGSTKEEVPQTMTWQWTETEPDGFDPESHLEQLFRKVLKERLETAGAKVTELPTDRGNRWTIRLDGRRWTLDPQVDLLGCRPDFVLRSEQPDVPEVAILTDGLRYHASESSNRLADDAEKREVLRESGRLVLAVTWQDLQLAPAAVSAPPWYAEDNRGMVMSASGGALKPSAVDLLSRGPVDFLLHWLQRPDADGVGTLADWLPMFAVRPDTVAYQVPAEASLVSTAAELLDGNEPSPAASPLDGAWTYRSGPFVLAARLTKPGTMATEVVAVLDDRTVGEDRADAWREWLRVSNLLSLRRSPTTITVRSLVDQAAGAALETPSPGEAAVAAAWPDLYEVATKEEQAVLDVVWQADAVRPELGVETDTGVPLAVSWPGLRVVVDVDLREDERDELTAAGWTIVPIDADAIRETLATTQERV